MDYRGAYIQRVIDNGNITASLCAGVEVKEVLKYLLRGEITDNTLMAYACICRKKFSQYIDGIHFCSSTNHISYKMVYIQLNRDLYVPSKEGGSDPLLHSMAEALVKLRDDSDEDSSLIRNICDPMPMTDQRSVSLVIGSDNEQGSLALLDTPEISDMAIEACINRDKLNLLSNVPVSSYEDLISDRCNFLLENMKDYWRAIENEYKLLVETRQFRRESKISSRISLSKIFEGSFGENIHKLDKESSRILSLPNEVRCYIMGYPIHLGLPTESELIKSVLMMQDNGVEAYAKEVSERNERLFSPEKISSVFGGAEMINKEDLFHQSIFTYNPFDVVSYCDGDKIYSFSRGSFKKLVKSGINPYTKSKLGSSVIGDMVLRSTLSSKLGLPECRCIGDLTTASQPSGQDKEADLKASVNRICSDIGERLMSGFLDRLDISGADMNRITDTGFGDLIGCLTFRS